MKKVLLTGTAVAALMGGSALAADMPLKAAPQAPYWNWSGFYVGIQAGSNYGTTQSIYGNTGEAINDK